MPNTGHRDRVIRIALGVVIFCLLAYFGSWLGLLGIAMIVTGLIGWCPVYELLGISTYSEPI